MSSLWSWLRSPSNRIAKGTIFIAGCLAALLSLTGFGAALSLTNTTAFCVSCHEMEQTVYREYRKSIHYKNASGVRVSCPACHVPPSGLPKLWRELEASREVFHTLLGTIATKEQFEARRLRLARRVWQRMTANDSQACRRCHSYSAMAFHKQSRRAAKKMSEAKQDKTTCIECHKGIAHKLPQGYASDDD